jgi:hypothetical protein
VSTSQVVGSRNRLLRVLTHFRVPALTNPGTLVNRWPQPWASLQSDGSRISVPRPSF